MLWDLFVSHASEIKEQVVCPLVEKLESKGLRIWLDADAMSLNSSLALAINEGLAYSKYTLVVLSPEYLEKDWTLKELDAVIARDKPNNRRSIFVCYSMDIEDVQLQLPLLSGAIFLNFKQGLDELANQVANFVLPSPLAGSPDTPRYFTSFDFPSERIERALNAIELLGDPNIWASLCATRDLCDANVWLGTKNDTFVTVLHDLYSPLALFRKSSYSLERSFSTLTPEERLRYLILRSAFECMSQDKEIAACAKRLDYTPRVPDWRTRRASDPAKYWWQGVTPERFNLALPYFLSPNNSQGIASLTEYRIFRSVFHSAFSKVGDKQMELGVVANPLNSFTPDSRPVYVRILAVWHILYLQFIGASGDNASLGGSVSPLIANSEWITKEIEKHPLFQRAPECIQACCEYISAFVLPRLRV